MKEMSFHASINQVHDQMQAAGVETVAERHEAQDGVRCRYCEQGISCQLCSSGPCRIVKGRAERGVCGIDANGMVMRGLVQKAAMGLAAYTHHCREAAKTLRATALGQTPFRLTEANRLAALADVLGVPAGTDAERAVGVADKILAALNEDPSTESTMVRAFAPASRLEIWRGLGIVPGGPGSELVDATARTMTNIDGDWVSLAKTALRLGLASTFGALIPLQWIQDILFGTPAPHAANVDLGIIDPGCVNVMPHGHEPFVGAALIEAARRPENQAKAKAAGAKGLRVVGSIETGQELLQRFACDDVFVGLTGNWITQEMALATGAVDVLAADMNCTLPTLPAVAARYGTAVVPVSRLIGLPAVTERADYEPEKAAEIADRLIELAVARFTARRGRPAGGALPKQQILTGFSIEAVLGVLGGSLKPLLDVIVAGQIKGVVALVSCTTLRNGPQDSMTVRVARELIARDILVLSAGCGNAACQVAGLASPEAASQAGEGLRAVCTALGIPPILSFGTCADTGRLVQLVTAVAGALGVDPSALPVAVTAPEYMEQKAVVDAFGAVAFGLYTHVSPAPPVAGAPDVAQLLTAGVEGLTGGRLAVGDDPVAVAEAILAHIQTKRRGLGLDQRTGQAAV